MAGDKTPSVDPKAPTAAERLAVAARDRLADRTNARKVYRLGIVSTPDRPCPFTSVTIAGHAFTEETYHFVEDSRGGRLTKQIRPGCYEQLSDAEVARIKAEIPFWVVRWRNRANLLATPIDSRLLSSLDVETDEPIEPYLVIEEVK